MDRAGGWADGLRRAALAGCGLCIVATGATARAAEPVPAADAGALPTWERTLYKTLTYQAVANLSDLALFSLVLGGTASAGTAFLAVNALSAAGLYYPYEYLWATVGPSSEETTHATVAFKTAVYRMFNASRNFALGYAFAGQTTLAAGFVAANFVTDTAIFVTNEYAWDVFRPQPPR